MQTIHTPASTAVPYPLAPPESLGFDVVVAAEAAVAGGGVAKADTTLEILLALSLIYFDDSRVAWTGREQVWNSRQLGNVALCLFWQRLVFGSFDASYGNDVQLALTRL